MRLLRFGFLVTVLSGDCLPFVDELHHRYDHDGYDGYGDLQPVCDWIVDPHRTQGTKSDDGDGHQRRWHDPGCHEVLDVALVRYIGGDSNVQRRGHDGRAGRDASHRGVSDHDSGLRIAVAPITTTFTGTLQSSDNRNGTFTVTVQSAIDPTPKSVSAQVTGTLRIQDDTIAVTGFFESLTGAITFSGSEASYRFDGVVTNGALTASFTAPNEVSGVIASTSTTVS